MKPPKFSFILLSPSNFCRSLLFFLLLASPALRAQQRISIIPQPVSLEPTSGSFVIDQYTGIVFDEGDRQLNDAARFLSSYIRSVSGLDLPLQAKRDKVIELTIQSVNDIGREGYLMDVTPSFIRITANSKAGIVYGMQSLFQTLPWIRTNAVLQVPCMRIKDYPRFRWRGMHLDVSRHFFSPEVVKEFIDLLARYKFNTFHWHLCDTQGWRLEIKQYPKLTEVGAWRVDRRGVPWRKITPAGEGEPATYGGYYTQEQVKDIVAYAQARNITIVPEIEMPGHSQAAIAAYPFLSCTQQPQRVLPGRGRAPDYQLNYCAGNDSVFVFLENVLDEVMQLFPSEYIHVGGDEVNKYDWERCARCQARIRALDLKNEEGLQSYFMKRIGTYLSVHGRKLIGWDEILQGGLPPSAAVMSWRGESGGIQAAKMHHDVVMTPGKPLYFDKYQSGPLGEPPAIGGFNTLKMVYDYDPVPEELTRSESTSILGAQANVWTEFISTREHLEYMILPRMLALSEATWSPLSSKDWNSFYHRLDYHFRGFEQQGFTYGPFNYNVTIQSSSRDGKTLVTLSTEVPDADIFYTVDGSDPTGESQKYTEPIVLTSPVVIKAATFIAGTRMTQSPAEKRVASEQ